MKTDIVILGVGNLLRSDDGVGVHAVQALANGALPAGVQAVDVGTAFLHALPFLEDARWALVMDAVRGDGAPGTIYRLSEGDLLPRASAAPAHALNLLEARRLLPPAAPWPEVEILGVEPACLEYGTELSPPVSAALSRVVACAREIVEHWSANGSACGMAETEPARGQP